MSTLNMPPKNAHAASHPAITAAVVCENVKNTKQYRENTAVNTSACSFRASSLHLGGLAALAAFWPHNDAAYCASASSVSAGQ
jgi:hypothetical protein